MKILGVAQDKRTDTPVVYAQVPIRQLLEIVGPTFGDFSIQRRREKHRAYERLKRDLSLGALLPSIILAVEPQRVPSLKKLFFEQDFEALGVELQRAGGVNILDGLQRTYIIQDLVDDGIEFALDHMQHLEFWLEESTDNLVYRMIVLNAGQKAMSMRHQVELLFSTLKERLQAKVPGLVILSEKDGARRHKSRSYPLDRLATSYQAYVTKSPEITRENVVAQELVESEVLDSSEQEITEQFNRFVELLADYATIDDDVCRIYPERDKEEGVPTGASWFGSDNVMLSFFAAYAQFSLGSEPHSRRAGEALASLRNLVRHAPVDSDPMGLLTLVQIQKGLSPRKHNVGFATRRLLTGGFKEYFRNGGEESLENCWKFAAE
ncbi:hypothetical protein [Stenotrophomonas chelatiphaga]|uniref:hypothetical protein n=1 Tax=Stenotrophomonas chelatiphaga TaxID=517011 RepID=UPI00289930F0|nr:hypothetical protein [Stenotrophomonas chelatiphaga]